MDAPSPRGLRLYSAGTAVKGIGMTFLWFVIWLIANSVGEQEPLLFAPVNAWAAFLILAIALDLSAAHARGSAKKKT